MDTALKRSMLQFQENEITEHIFYTRLSARTKDPHNKEVLAKIAGDELRHYEFWKKHTGVAVTPNRFGLAAYSLLARVFGLTFASKLMERGEEKAQVAYQAMRDTIPGIEAIIADEEKHEMELLRMLKEKRLTYVSSIVLGLNDALVELTGTLAGLTFAFQNAQLIALSGFITGVAASFSMAASEYLSHKSEGIARKEAARAALYTGIAYIVVVLLLIAPYFILGTVFGALATTLLIGLAIIAIFSFYIAIVQETSFKEHAGEMAALSLGVAALSFVIGIAARKFLGIDVG